jgi:F-type H+-transporting ATPase subunit epsilon
MKAGSEVLVSVRNAIGGVDLGKLHESVKKEFLNLDEDERKTRTVMAKLESGFMHSLEKFRKD